MTVFLKKYLLIGVILEIAAITYLIAKIPDNRFHIYFLNVDQGDSIFVKTPENHHILVDGGPENFVLEELGKVMPFFDRTIDLAILTHPHADHMDGLVEILKKFEVKALLITGVSVEDDTYRELLKTASAKNVPIFFAERKNDFKLGEVIVDILYPFSALTGDHFENINNSSIGINLIYRKKQILMLGDLEIDKEKELIKRPLPQEVEIYKASHHGSRTASSMEFLEIILPKNVVISAGKNNKFKHPHPETIRNFYKIGTENIYRTDIDGTIEFSF